VLGVRFGLRVLNYGMKAILDKYITENYAEVRTYTNYFLVRFKSFIDADTVINNSYIHVVNINDPLPTIEKVKSYLFNTIKYQVIWTSSLSNRHDRINSMPFIVDKDTAEDTTDLDAKILADKTYNLQKAVIEIYRQRIKDSIQKTIFEAYIDKGYNTARSMAKYFDITTTSAHYIIKDLKHELNELQYSYED